MKLKKLSAFSSAIVLSISSLLMIVFPGIAHATPLTCSWTGATNNNFSNAGNWSSCNSAAPVNGSNLIFNFASTLNANVTLNNDISGLSVGSMTFSATNPNNFSINLGGNGITVSGGITNSVSSGLDITANLTLSGSQAFTGNGITSFLSPATLAIGSNTLTIGSGSDSQSLTPYIITGSGTINVDNGASLNLYNANPGWTGTINAASGTQVSVNNTTSLGASQASISLASGACLALEDMSGGTIANNITVGGSGGACGGALYAQTIGGPGNDNVTLSGTITLTSNTVAAGDGAITVTGPLSGSYTLTEESGQTGSVVINSSNNTSLTPNGNQQSQLQVTTVASGDNQPGLAVNVGSNQEEVIDGGRGFTTVFSGGLLKGTGSVTGLSLLKGSTVSPGDAPGCITDNGNLNEGGTYQEEIGGTTACSGFDQLDVTGTVTLDDGGTPSTQGILDVSLINGFKPTAGQTFEIINNEGSGAVADTFANQAEGSTITVSGYVFKISYKGGTGNDVVLTVVSVPATPNTGFGLTSAHVELPLIGGLTMAGGLYLISRKARRPLATKRR